MQSTIWRKGVLFISMNVIMAIIIEILSTLFLYQKYHNAISESLNEGGRFATVQLFRKFFHTFNKGEDIPIQSSTPAPFRIPDSLHGFRIASGRFEVMYKKRHFDNTQSFKYYVSVNPDGSRYVGEPGRHTEKDVFVFGDSFVFGEGVNDEQTFTYMLQSHFRRTKFHLYANPCYSLTNAYLNFQRLSPSIGPEDVIILGYAQFYDERHVASPDRMKVFGAAHSDPKFDSRDYKHVRARLVNDSLFFDKIPFFCEYMKEYCNQEEPRQSLMDSVTARLINGIATRTQALVYLMPFSGNVRKEMTSQLHPRIRILDANWKSFDYMYRDDINGFDPHPGPYWNHAIFRRVRDTLDEIGLK